MEPLDDVDIELLIGYLEAPDRLSDAQQVLIDRWLNSHPQHQAELDQLRQLWVQSQRASIPAQLDVAADRQRVWAQIQRQTSTASAKRRFLRPMWRVAAAITLLLTSVWGAWYLTQRFSAEAPYTYAATDSVITVSLPDGSQVYLNKAARLSYNDNFGESTRSVRLEGEGYFEVAHNPAVPFLIDTGPTNVRVVGTTFNVRTDNQAVKVTVSSGQVAFAYQQDTLMLTQNEVGLYQDDGLREFMNDDLNHLAWKTGILTFKDTPLPQVVRDLTRHYEVPMRIDNEELNDLTFTSTLDRQPLEEVLEELRAILDIDYTYQDEQVTLL